MTNFIDKNIKHNPGGILPHLLLACVCCTLHTNLATAAMSYIVNISIYNHMT